MSLNAEKYMIIGRYLFYLLTVLVVKGTKLFEILFFPIFSHFSDLQENFRKFSKYFHDNFMARNPSNVLEG